jgi:hypothetical protein
LLSSDIANVFLLNIDSIMISGFVELVFGLPALVVGACGKAVGTASATNSGMRIT